MTDHTCARCGEDAYYRVAYTDDKPSEWLCGPHFDEVRDA